MPRSFSPVPWAYRTNLYEVNVRQYTPEGSFTAFAQHLSRLRDMGVETLWFMPVTPISHKVRQGTLGSYYACSSYTRINPEFGTHGDFAALVSQAHELGMKVIIDWVANHTGWDHEWTLSHPGFFKRNGAGEFYDKNGWHDVIDLNYYDGEMRAAMIEAMAYWVREFGIDGFRCDMAHLVPLDFWRQARQALDVEKPLFWLAETEDVHYLDVFDCCYAWHWMHETEHYIKGTTGLSQLKAVLERYANEFPVDTFQLFFTSNHDENSWNGTEYEKYGPAAKALAVFSCTWNGLPLIYSGQELPNTRRLKFFDKDLIEWTHLPLLHGFYKSLLELRSSHPALRTGITAKPAWVPFSDSAHVFSFRRRNEGGELLVVLNLSDETVAAELLCDQLMGGTYRELFSGASQALHRGASFIMKPWEATVWVSEK